MNTMTYTLEEAITLMRNTTKLNRSFSIKFRKLGGGTTLIQTAALRPMASTSKDRNGKYKLQLVDKDNEQFRSCYIILIMEVNGIKIKINNGT